MQIISEVGSDDVPSTFGSNTLPDLVGVLGEWWLGGTTPPVNAMTGVAATEVGAPGYHDAYVTVGNPGNVQKGFITDVGAESDAVTIVALVRGVAAAGYIAAPYDPANEVLATLNYNLLVSPAGVGSFSAGNGQRANGTDQAVLVTPDNTKFTFVMGVYLLSTPGRIYLVDDGGTLMDDGAAAFTPGTREAHVIKIGGMADVNFMGSADVAALALVDGAKGQAYAEELYPMWKSYGESRGLAIN
jgi:hypothetical protein